MLNRWQSEWNHEIMYYSCFHLSAESLWMFFFAVALICNVGKGPQYECKSKSVDVTPMPPYISNDLKGRIPALHHKQGYSVKKICQLLNIKKTLVYETLKHHRTFSVPYDPNAWRRGLRPRCLTTTDLLFIRALLNQQHTVYLDEVQEQLLSR